jgi:hypothetical protein
MGPSACVPSAPSTEVCDGIDNNCNGMIDEKLKNACGGPCMTAVPPEDCSTTTKDDNCDGEVNEGCPPTCVRTVPATEVCDGKDNDCDGEVDNGSPEVCDNQDNDCDGVVDNGAKNECGGPCSAIVAGHRPGAPCTNGFSGACETAGFYECVERAYTACNAPLGNNKPETCDGLDNNCDTLVDNVGFGVGTTWRITCPGGDSSVLYACTMPAVKPGCIVAAE